MAKPASQRSPTIESLKERIARDPFSRAFLQLAEEYRREGRFQEAIDVCLEGLQRHPVYHTARIALGRTYMDAGNLDAARRAFAEVLELQPENHLAAKLLAEIQKKCGDLAGAAATYRAILGHYPNDREVAALLQEALQPAAPAGAAAAGVAAPPPAMPAPAVPRVVPMSSPAPDPSPDFRAEDLGGLSVETVREPWVAPSAALSSARTAPAPKQAAGTAEDDALQTNTLAELYLRQGLVDRAIEVYRGMLRVDPGNQKAARRLGDLVPGGAPAPSAGAPGPDAPAAGAGTPPKDDAGRAAAPRAAAAAAPARGESDHRRRVIGRLERWIDTVRAGAGREARPR